MGLYGIWDVLTYIANQKIILLYKLELVKLITKQYYLTINKSNFF